MGGVWRPKWIQKTYGCWWCHTNESSSLAMVHRRNRATNHFLPWWRKKTGNEPFLTMVTEEIRQVKNDNYRERFEPDDNPCVLNPPTVRPNSKPPQTKESWNLSTYNCHTNLTKKVIPTISKSWRTYQIWSIFFKELLLLKMNNLWFDHSKNLAYTTSFVFHI